VTTDILYTPWRMKYIASKEKMDGCVFCSALDDEVENDPDNYLLFRGESTFAVMNIYPYNPGHIMVLPRQHASHPADLPAQVHIELTLLTTYFVDLLTTLMQPDGFNIGTNIGRAAGAGIADHLHTHIVPRWSGDANFMTVVGDTRVLPQTLGETYDKIMALLKKQPPDLKS